MHIMTENHLKYFAKKHVESAPSIDRLVRILKKAEWKNLEQTRESYPHADEAMVKSGRKVTILNLGGNNWRVITAIHYNRQIIYILAVLSHAEYSREKWKETL
jgi:mRNA interferase HigB